MAAKVKHVVPGTKAASPQSRTLDKIMSVASAAKFSSKPPAEPPTKPNAKPGDPATRKANLKPTVNAVTHLVATVTTTKVRAPAAQPGLTEVERRLSDYAVRYEKKADGKAGVQKFGDFIRAGVTGYGDHQFRNIGESRQALDSLKVQVRSRKLTQAQADKASNEVLKKFSVEEVRVTKAQAENAEVGKSMHGAGRVVVVGVSAAVATVGGGGVNVVAGAAAAVAAGSVYDAITVADQGKSVIAPQLDGGTSVGGLLVQSAKGKKLSASDVARGVIGTATDAVNGAAGAHGIFTARVKQLAVQHSAAQAGRRATGFALGVAAVKAGAVNNLGQTAANAGMKTLEIASNASLTGEKKTQMASENLIRTVMQLPGQLGTGAVSNLLGPVARISNKGADAILQFALNGMTNVAQSSITNFVDGKGFKLSKADLAAALVSSSGAAIQNLTRRVPQRSASEVLAHVGTMHPYEGAALAAIPHHADGTTVVIGKWADKPLGGGSGPRVVHLDRLNSTQELWAGADALIAGSEAKPPFHVYRTFEHPLTGERMAIKTNLVAVHAIGQRDQTAMDKLTKKAGLSESIPVRPLVDESPSNLLPRSHADRGASALLRTAAWALRGAGVVPNNKLGLPSEWLSHFLAGSGTPKVMSQKQVAAMFDNLSEIDALKLNAHASKSLHAEIASQRAKGLLTGKLEINTSSTSDLIFRATEKGGWGNVLGSFHAAVSYKGSWKVGVDGNVYFKGDQRFLVQDRYNWEAKEFNGSTGTAPIPGLSSLPGVAFLLLPNRYLKAFSYGPDGALVRKSPQATESTEVKKGGATDFLMRPDARQSAEFGGRLTDGMLAQLQMVQGGAQPFWTFGLSPSKRVELSWNPADQ